MDVSSRQSELRELVHQRITALVQEMEEADWSARDVVTTIEAVINEDWLPQYRALDEARAALPKDYVSDGNEG